MGDTVKGKVVVMADYGAFVEIAPGVEGLIHVSEMSWSQHLRSAQDFMKVGDEVEIFALPMSDGINRLSTVDCVLLGPQVRFNLGKIKEEAAKVNPGLPVDVIDMKDYGMMNGEAVYKKAKAMMGE